MPGETLNVRDFIDSMRAVEYAGTPLPPHRLRSCGQRFQDNRFYLESAEREAKRLVETCGLQKATPILHIGCGTGRLATGILRFVGEADHYRGIDVSKRAIKWCHRFIAEAHPGFVFLRANVRNERYNPRGNPIGDGFRLPFRDSEFSLVYAYSVFSHMLAGDLRHYLIEIRRITSPHGKLFFSAFAEPDVPDVSVNPPGYHRDWGETPLHCVRYNRAFLVGLLSQAQFRLDRVDYETETDWQSAFYASKPKAAG